MAVFTRGVDKYMNNKSYKSISEYISFYVYKKKIRSCRKSKGNNYEKNERK